MKHIRNKLLQVQGGVLSLEEIEAEIAAVEPAPEAVDDLIPAEADPIDTEADALETDTADVEESLDEIETGIDVDQNLEDTVTVMESLLTAGDCSMTEYVALSEYAGTQLSRLGVESFTFAAEGIESKETRMENLRFAMEAVQENKAKVKKALDDAAKSTEAKAASLWDKLLALLGNRVKRAKVMLSKVDGISGEARETVAVGTKVARMMIDNDPHKTLASTRKAADYFYGSVFDDIAEWSSHKTKIAPRINDAMLSDLPKGPRITFGKSTMDFEFDTKGSEKSFTVKTHTKAELKSILKEVSGLFETIKRATAKFSGLMSKIAQIYFAFNTASSAGTATAFVGPVAGVLNGLVSGVIGHGLLMLFSRGYNTSVKMNRVYNYFGDIGTSLIDYVGYHVAAYK